LTVSRLGLNFFLIQDFDLSVTPLVRRDQISDDKVADKIKFSGS